MTQTFTKMFSRVLRKENAGRNRAAVRCPMSFSARKDAGFGLIEALATIAILAALTAGAIIAVPRLLNRGQDSAASASLTTAVTEAREIYSRVNSTGGTNFLGGDLPTGTYDADDLTVAAVNTLNQSETSLCYYPLTSGTATPVPTGCAAPLSTLLTTDTGVAAMTTANAGSTGADLIRAKGTNGVWVLVTPGEDWDGTAPDETRAGQVIRIGTSSQSGATYCAIIVGDHVTVGNTGTAYEARSEASSNTKSAISDAANDEGWADCGAHRAEADRDTESPAAGLSATIPTPS